ncbi:cation:proton antiporter [Candidatus Woesearchaeota archaeon]|nr:cation:proton antiporter [Candidatus Woesearchaeota archaeon]
MSGAEEIGVLILKLFVILASAKFAGVLAEKLKQPAVLGEILAGVILGPSIFGFIQPGGEAVLTFLAEIGVILLLFEVGLESNIHQLLKSGLASLLVATIGVAVPFGLGYYYSIAAGFSNLVAIFIGATLTATSVGVTMRVFSDLNKVQSEEAKVILGAAVIDDVIGLIILSVLVGIVETGTVSMPGIGKILLYSVVFLVASIAIGIRFTPFIFRIVHALNIRRTFVISAFLFALALAFVANKIGLATIVGAFAAGLILEQTQHKEHIIERIKPVSNLFVPLFFVMAGVYLNVWSMFEPGIFHLVLVILGIAVVGKMASGLGCVRTKARRYAVGLGMIPRGEVGLIFASYGLTTGLATEALYSALVIVIMLSTLIVPPLLKPFVK